MIELNVSKFTDVDGASFYKLSPSVIKFGALNDEKVNKIHVNVPEEFSGLTQRLSFIPAKKGLESFAMLLDDTGDIDVSRAMTEATGVITFDAFGEDIHVHTNDIQWTIITHSPVSNGSEPEYTPTQVEQILAQTQSKVNEAQSFANSASTSANTSAGAAALATELATSAQRSAEAAANSRSLAAMNADASMAFSNKAEQEADRAEEEADRSKSEADRSGAIADGIRTEYNGAFSDFKEEYTADFGASKEDILHYKNDAEASAQRAEQSATRAEQDYTELDTRKMERYVMRLVKNADNTYKFTSLEDEDLSFDEVYNVTKKLNEYVVVLYGNNKLRPQYVSTNEIMFIGVDRSTETKVLRILYTPTRLSYETFKLAESTDLASYVKNTDYATFDKGGVIKSATQLGTFINSNGAIAGSTRTYSQYTSDSDLLITSKGTIENIWSARNITLTQSEYDALTTKDPLATYFIVEEE